MDLLNRNQTFWWPACQLKFRGKANEPASQHASSVTFYLRQGHIERGKAYRSGRGNVCVCASVCGILPLGPFGSNLILLLGKWPYIMILITVSGFPCKYFMVIFGIRHQFLGSPRYPLLDFWIPGFWVPGFWVSQILSFPDFEFPRFWVFQILSFAVSINYSAQVCVNVRTCTQYGL